jgi:two-component system, chemotaxis family, sensor kinase CheA
MAFQGRVLNDLQHSVMKIRMVPVEQLFRRFPRIVRDVGLQCGKEVELIVRGGQTDLDKSILDAIAEPLTHLVRNAIGHGIESPRSGFGPASAPREPCGWALITRGIRWSSRSPTTARGIDAEKVRQRALAQGLLKPSRQPA